MSFTPWERVVRMVGCGSVAGLLEVALYYGYGGGGDGGRGGIIITSGMIRRGYTNNTGRGDEGHNE
jgi:hypothetical protein